jgi:hypothetical protein
VRVEGAGDVRWDEEARTDERGVLVLRDLPPGPARVTVLEPGLLPTSVETTLADGRTVGLRLVEPVGMPAEIEVVDHLGRPVPCAAIEARAAGRPYVFLDGDVQHLGHRTDTRGRTTLLTAPGFPLSVTARYGSRKATGTVEAGHRLRIHLK